MKSLSREERARKFQVNKNDVGLRSRGHRKLSKEEQERLFSDLVNQNPSTRLEHLRVLREAIRSTSDTLYDNDFEVKVYESSIRECISQSQFETVPHMLAHLTSRTNNTSWIRLLTISLSNTRKFHQAYLKSQNEKDLEYVTCVVNKDFPIWELLVSEEKDPIARNLMEQIRSELRTYQENVYTTARRHPRQAKPAAATASSGSG